MNKKITEYNDQELFEFIKAKSRREAEAFSELYDRYSPRVFAYCRRFFNDNDKAKDAFQEVFIRFYQALFKLDELTNVPAFLIRITRNYCITLRSQEKDLVSFEEYMSEESSFIQKMERDEMLSLVNMAMDLLPKDAKDILILREYNGLSYQDIMEVTGESMDNVKVKIHRARKKVREILSPYMNELNKIENNK